MNVGGRETDIKSSFWYQQHMEKLRNKCKTEDKIIAEKPVCVASLDDGNTAANKTSQARIPDIDSLQRSAPEVKSQSGAPPSGHAPQPALCMPKQENLLPGIPWHGNSFNDVPEPNNVEILNDLNSDSLKVRKDSTRSDMQSLNSSKDMATPSMPFSTGYLSLIVPQNSSAVTSTPVTKKHADTKAEVKMKIQAQLDKINSKYGNFLTRAKNVWRSSDSNIEDLQSSPAYLEHLRKLKKTAAGSGNVVETKPEDKLKNFDKLKSNAYMDHLQKLQTKDKPALNNFGTVGLLSSRPIISDPSMTNSFAMVKKESDDQRVVDVTSTNQQSPKHSPVVEQDLYSQRKSNLFCHNAQSVQGLTGINDSTESQQTAEVQPKKPSCSVTADDDDLPISDEEEFVTLDSVGTGDSGDEESQTDPSLTGTDKNDHRCKETSHPIKGLPLKGILKRTHNDSKKIPVAIKVSRPDSENRVKPNLTRPEPEAIEVVPSMRRSQDKISDTALDSALAAGLEFIRPVSGYQCVACHTFYHDYSTALHHCTLLTHKMKIIKEQSGKDT